MEADSRSILFRHLSGSKANSTDRFEIKESLSIRLGRKAGSDVLYDATQDDLVSREHAVVTLADLGTGIFTISDLGSSNGTFVNGIRISAPHELAPGDTVELGSGGPKFTFDIQPRPEHYAGKTRVMQAVDSAVTRILTRPADLPNAVPPAEEIIPPKVEEAVRLKVGVGKETVERMLVAERTSTSRSWTKVAVALGVLTVAAAGGMYAYTQYSTEKVYQATARQMQQQNEELERVRQDNAHALTREIGSTAREIVEKYGNATVTIDVRWGLYDAAVGKPLFLKTLYDADKRLRPCFIRTSENEIVPWLTLDDESRSNLRVGGAGSGSGFVVSENGFILTNKHVAAAWMTPYEWPFSSILLIPEDEKRDLKNWDSKAYKEFVKTFYKNVDELPSRAGGPRNWIPEQDKGLVFHYNKPIRISSWRTFAGRTEELVVRFPNSRLGMTASFVRASTDADAALIKIDTPQLLSKVQLADNDELVVGDRVTVLGYPAVSIQDKAIVTSTEGGLTRTRSENVPQPTVTEGIISRVGAEINREKSTLTTFTDFGETFQLSINSTGAGNSGGPVFSKEGRVIGLYTYGLSYKGTSVSLAVPIKHGRALLQAQRSY